MVFGQFHNGKEPFPKGESTIRQGFLAELIPGYIIITLSGNVITLQLFN